jgi:hypothetical protein
VIPWADSFDHYGTDEANMLAGAWAQVDAWSLDTSQACTGTHALLSGHFQDSVLRRVFGGQFTSAGVGLKARFSGLPGGNAHRSLIEFRDQFNVVQVAIAVQSTGKLAIYNQAPSAASPLLGLLAESDMLLPAGAWNHVEALVEVDGAAGSVEVRLNQVTAVSITGANTDPTGAGEVSQFASTNSVDAGDADCWLDDIVPNLGEGSASADFIGDKKVYTDFPDADTADQDWTPSSGSARFAMVDEADPDGDGTYDEAGVVDDVMGLSFPDLPAEVVAIAAVCMVHKSRKTDAGTCTLQLKVQSGVDEADGEDRPMTTQFTLYEDVVETDPATSLPWTPVAVNAMTSTLTRTA